MLVSFSESAWNAMSLKLRCGHDLMKLQLSGPDVANVELCQGNGVPVPLTQLPPHCGHATLTYGGLVYATPYDGCGVAQQGGNYVMQIQWKGNFAVISCPMISTTTNEAFLGPHPPEYLQVLLPHSSPDASSPEAPAMLQLSDTATLKPSLSGYPQVYPQGFWPYYPHYPGRVYSVIKQMEEPATTDQVAQAPTGESQQLNYPQMFWPHYYNPYYGQPKPGEKPVPGSFPDTESDPQEPTGESQPLNYPQMFWPQYYNPYYGQPKPGEKPVPDTESDPQEPTGESQPLNYPQMFWPQYYNPYYGQPKPGEKPVPGSFPDTESDPQEPTGESQQLNYPQMFWPHYYNPYYGQPKPGEKPVPGSFPDTESDPQEPTEKPELSKYPEMVWPYYYPPYHYPVGPKPTEKPAPAIPTAPPAGSPATTTQKLQPPAYPGSVFPQYSSYPNYPLYLQQFYPQYPVQPPKTPTAQPITTTPQPCTTTTAAECKPSANQPPKVPPQQYIPPRSMHYEKDPFAFQFVDFSETDPKASL